MFAVLLQTRAYESRAGLARLRAVAGNYRKAEQCLDQIQAERSLRYEHGQFSFHLGRVARHLEDLLGAVEGRRPESEILDRIEAVNAGVRRAIRSAEHLKRELGA